MQASQFLINMAASRGVEQPVMGGVPDFTRVASVAAKPPPYIPTRRKLRMAIDQE